MITPVWPITKNMVVVMSMGREIVKIFFIGMECKISSGVVFRLNTRSMIQAPAKAVIVIEANMA